MRVFFGTELGGWKLWGVWFKKKYYFGFSKQVVEGTYLPTLNGTNKLERNR